MAIGKRIGSVLEVSKVSETGEWGRYVRLRIKIPLDQPIRRGGNVVLGVGERCWVDYKYERLPIFCYYCGMLDHECRDCAVRGRDVSDGSVKENPYGPWMAAAPSSRRGYKWNNTEDMPLRRSVGSGGGRERVTVVDSGSLSGGRRGRAGHVSAVNGKDSVEMVSAENGKDSAAIGMRDSQLIEVTDNSVVAINGTQFKMGDLVPYLSGNVNIANPSGGSGGHKLLEDRSFVERADKYMGQGSKQAHILDEHNTGQNLELLVENRGVGLPISGVFGPASKEELGLSISSPQLVEVQIFKASDKDGTSTRAGKGGRGKAIRGKGGKGKSTKILSSLVSESVESSKDLLNGDGNERAGHRLGKRSLEMLDELDSASLQGKRLFMGNDVTTVRVEAANPNGPPIAQ
ncbi:hypothetical protein Vadar_022719 [Vaccinium darrowii]|uniref:Uncharacterized protein n=1 Tax=Vaccinium darrowii TaxID=229202 RepID=A0ACB7XSC8_9ERIC|nr:hypothetical protein Vadar_022719 [Vaccinium darrowii]